MDFIPYARQTIDEEDIKSVAEALKQDFITTGPLVERFEEKIARRVGSRFCVAVSSGTAALYLAALALLKPGMRVLVTPNTFLATVNAITLAHAEPIFVDIAQDGNIDLDLCERLLKQDDSIGALFGVHFSGNPLNQDKLARLKQNYGIIVVEDCAHALGAVYNSVKSGSCKNSEASIFSFHPVKQITTAEGGAITTNSKELRDRLYAMRNSGIVRSGFKNLKLAYDKKGNPNPWYYEMHSFGFNFRISDIQCALGISQLNKLDQFLRKRHTIARRYHRAFDNDSLIRPLYPYNEGSAYHLFVVRIDFDSLNITRAEFFEAARKKGIGLQVHYIPVYAQPFYAQRGATPACPNMEEYYSQCVSIPMYPGLLEDQQEYVIETLKRIVQDAKK